MNTNFVTRWEEWRSLTGGSARHRKAVADWLQSHPAILYWGDSWFSTPLYPNLARQSAVRIEGLRMIVGKPGATAARLFAAKEVERMVERIRNNPFDLVCLSAGGNDALSDRLAAVFAPWMKSNQPRITARAAFDILLQSQLFPRVVERYSHLLDALQKKVSKQRKHFRVMSHTYAPLRRIGVAGDLTISNIGLIAMLKDDVGPWLWEPMKRVLADVQDGAVFANLLLGEGFRDSVLVELESSYRGFFSWADLAAVAALDDPTLWHDEIHPTEAGFARCIPTFQQAIRDALPLAKQDAVN